MTGLLGGGHADLLRRGDAAHAEPRLLRRGAGPARAARRELLDVEVPFGAELVQYAVGAASCGVPGLPAGLVALWQAYGRLAVARGSSSRRCGWRSGRRVSVGACGLPRDARPGDDAERGRGDLLPRRKLAGRRRPTRAAGARRARSSCLPRRPAFRLQRLDRAQLLDLCAEREGLVTQADLDAYEALWSEPVDGRLTPSYACSPAAGSRACPRRCRGFHALPGPARPERVLALLDALDAASSGEATRRTSRRRRRRQRLRADDAASASARATGCPASTCT